MSFIKQLLSNGQSESRSIRPWKHYEQKAKDAEQRNDLETAEKMYELALEKLNVHFEPIVRESRYYRYKYSSISFQLNKVKVMRNRLIED